MNSGVIDMPPSIEKPSSVGTFHSVGAPPASQPAERTAEHERDRRQQHRPRLPGVLERSRASRAHGTTRTTPTSDESTPAKPWPSCHTGTG